MRWAALLVSAALLSACATPQRAVQPGEELWSGRLAMTVQSDPPQSFSAGFDLRGTPSAGELQLTTPLGTSLATVVWSPGRAEMRQGGQVTRRGSLDELTTELSGTAVPVAALFGWLRGQAGEVPGWQADLSRQAEGRITARRIAPVPTAELRVVVEP
ncbi:lipoprotein insertase outer membrane protein LolB [Hydrogenophaga sp.]|jgi:outer membrane lipoprotein LolB|uniref:lipoprotein insertase outer membrane protein LolB n=1 Tax=Hydrogenophaga sp. TaxID=1904254 RepID=UPI002612C86D|nr:lipoprotein insertase outer membrane protein LolB [Hydrogenophaga sp.]